MTNDPDVLFEGVLFRYEDNGGPIVHIAGDPVVMKRELVGRRVRVVAADPAPTGRTPDADVHVERCGSSECPCYQEGHGAGAELAAEFVAALRDDAADPAPTGDQT